MSHLIAALEGHRQDTPHPGTDSDAHAAVCVLDSHSFIILPAPPAGMVFAFRLQSSAVDFDHGRPTDRAFRVHLQHLPEVRPAMRRLHFASLAGLRGVSPLPASPRCAAPAPYLAWNGQWTPSHQPGTAPWQKSSPNTGSLSAVAARWTSSRACTAGISGAAA